MLTVLNSTRAAALALGLLCTPGLALAGDDAIKAPATKTIGQTAGPAKSQVEPSLIVMNSRGARLDGTTLTLTGVSPNSIIFADRPVRAAGHALTAHLLEEWGKGAGKEGFAADPPNATVSVLSNDGSSVSDAVVVLKSPKLEGDKLTFEVQVLEGDLANADGPASVFIATAFVDGDGNVLYGTSKYVLHFNKDEMLPSESGVWSVSPYRENFYVRNSINRYGILSGMPLKYNGDGSLDIFIQAKSPGADKEANWLPCPPSDPFNLSIRVYQPKKSLVDGSYEIPPIKRVA